MALVSCAATVPPSPVKNAAEPQAVAPFPVATAPREPPAIAQAVPPPPSTPESHEPAQTSEPPVELPRSRAVAWLSSRLPSGGELVDLPGQPIGIVHVARQNQTSAQIAQAYVDLTDVYLARDLNLSLRKENNLGKGQPQEGDRVVVPMVMQEAPKPADQERLGWPEDSALRGLYVRGATAEGALFPGLLEHMAERRMNLIVLDTKDYDGFVTYASTVPLAIETNAAKGAPLHDLPRTIRFAHKKGIRVAMRISCFEDELVARAKPSLTPFSKLGGHYPIGWLDPANEQAQGYVIDLAKEAILAGADEIQLDYVRYPVLGIKNADFDKTKGNRDKTEVIRDFVHKIHEVTEAHHVPLSLDIFGVVADGSRADIGMLGQDPVLLAQECEALSPMVYPSHYRPGYMGFEIPGNHPEIVGVGTKRILQMLSGTPGKALIRPWLQAVSYNSPDYGPPYVAAEIRHADKNGGTGWLMWNPAQTYSVTWSAVLPKKIEVEAAK